MNRLEAPSPRWLVVAALSVLAATAATGETRKVVADEQYAASGFHKFFFGRDYRDLWTTPASFEVLDLTHEAGGLSPVRRVGGQQTKGLALKGKDGKNYTFRGLDKDPSKILEEDLRDTVVARLLQDQMAAQNPASESIARVLLDAAGVPCPAWRLVVLPDDPALGDFRKDFAGEVGMFAEYPSAVSATNPGFQGVTEIVDHLELYKRLEAGGPDHADVQALLRARLVDLFMGDWDRHRKQWRWAKFPGSELWKPIPEDRDQAFSRYEGLVLDFGRGTDPRFQNLKAKYPGITGLTFNGYEQDRRLLIGLTREDFHNTALSLQAALTDEVIDRATHAQPEEWYALEGPRLAADLKGRRAGLPGIADKFYLHINKRADVYLSDASERIEAKRSAGELTLTVHRVDDPPDAPPTFSRVFHAKETEEVRLYALGGNDQTVVSGGSGMRLRMVGGNGNDSLDASGSGNAKLSDSSGGNKVVDAGEDTRVYTPPPPPKTAPWIPPRDWGGMRLFVPWVGYSSDLGVFVGGGLDWRSFGFRKDPFANQHILRAGYAFGAQGGRADYLGIYRKENSRSFWGLHLYGSGVDVLRFYGFGNGTPNSGDDDFYKVSASQALVMPVYSWGLAHKVTLSIGPALKYTETDQGEAQFINTVAPYGVGGFGQLGVGGGLLVNRRDSDMFPRHGGLFAIRGTVYPKVWDVTDTFGQLNSEARGYLSAGKVLTLAARVGGKKVWGTYPFHEAATLGAGGLEIDALSYPNDTLRGFRTGRFAGDAAAFGNADLRLKISRIKIVLPGTWGLVGSGDVGRVWLEGENDDTWHASAGAGVWLSFLNDRTVFSSGFQYSDEDNLFYFKGGFAF